MQLTLDIKPVATRDAATSLDIGMSPSASTTIADLLNLESLVLPSASVANLDENLVQLIGSQATTLDLGVQESPLETIRREFLASHIDTITSQSNTANDPLATGKAAFKEMERQSILDATLRSWSGVLNIDIVDSPAVATKQTSTYEDELQAFLAA